ncbi:MAG: chromosomal replication initiator protein DnaA [Muribaculaceae bacterium]|nr:chromosomal replication initiator protein DnaA [Muribaculaceae bacterium]
MTNTHQELWAQCCQFIKDNISPQHFDTWFRDITCDSFDAVERKLVLKVQSSFFVDIIEARFLPVVRAAVKKVFGENVSIFYRYLIVNNDPTTGTSQKSVAPSQSIIAQPKPAANPFRSEPNEDFDSQLNPRYTFENYCVGDSNKIACSIGEAIGNDPSLKTFNPLFVFGPSGVGKTHLIQAIGIRVKERNPQARVLYVTARLFQSQYTAAASKNINNFFHFYQGIDTLIIDDIQDLQNMPGTQNTFFHIFNHLHNHSKQIIMSSDRSPAEMEGFEERLLSRFKWGMQVELERPDISLRRSVLKLKAEQDGLSLPTEVAEYIVSNITNSVRELEGVVVSLVAHAAALNTDITLELAQRVLANAVKINRKQVNFEMVAEAVASYYNILPDQLFTKTRKREVSDARQVVMYLAKKLAKMPLTTIGHKIDRTHATVIYAINNIEDRMSTERKLVADINAIEASITGR